MGWPQVLPENIRLAGSEHQRRAALETLGVGFVAIAVIEEDAVTAANSGFSITPRIPRESNPRSGIESVRLQASVGLAGSAALHDAVERYCASPGFEYDSGWCVLGLSKATVLGSSAGALAGLHTVVSKLYSLLNFS